MLLRFQFSNFRSFRDEQELSMVSSGGTDHAETVLHPSGIDEGVLPVAAIYGANASGKTNVLRAIQFMQAAVRDSHARWLPDGAIDLDSFAGMANAPATFSVDFLLDGVRHEYGFSITREAVLKEWMYAYPLGEKQTWFIRKRDKPIDFGAELLGDNRTIERLTRPNSLFLSAAAQNNHQALSPVYRWFSQQLQFVVGGRALGLQPAESLLCRADKQPELARMLSSADFGIEGVSLQLTEVEDTPVLEGVSLILRRWVRQAKLLSRIQFMHRIGDSTVPLTGEQQSKGTIAFLSLLEPVTNVLTNGGVLWVDELDQSLHPLLAIKVIQQFTDPQSNPNSAQLIFNTHDTNLLSAGVLRRDQIWFTEKPNDGGSRLYPLTDFKPRKEENLESGYLQGRYGAIPFLNADRFLAQGHEEER
jgi:hypothetical protein